MVRLLSIILAISDTQNGIVLIDEIENGFHPSSQEILWNAIFKSAKEFNVQIFATTHSMECVEAFSSSYSKISQNNDDIRLYRIERKDDDFRAVSYDHRTLEASLESEWEVR
ncbi:MAG: ATP/GTP-binding protein [Methanosarcinales archaeon]